MASNKELFDLIKSLDPPEKRYLKKLMKALAGNKQRKYQEHFDKIVSMKKYDDLIWKRAMGLKASPKKIKETNNYLYDYILKGLAMYISVTDRSKNRVLVEAQKIHILHQKGLHETTYRRIQEMIDLSQKEQYFDLCLHLLNEKRSVGFSLGKLTLRDPDLYRVYDDFDVCLEKAKNINAFLRLLMQLRELFDLTETIRSPESESEFRIILSNPLLSDVNNALSPRAVNMYYVIKLALQSALMMEDESIRLCEEGVGTFSDPSNRLNNPLYVGFMLNKRLEMISLFGRWHEFDAWFPRFQKLSRKHTKNYHHRKYFLINGIRHRLNGAYHLQRTEELPAIEASFDAEFYETCRLDYASAFYECEFHFAKMYHLCGQYEEALAKIESILSNRQHVRNDLEMSARILHLIIHYDLNNNLYLPYAVQSLYRILRKSPVSYEPEWALVRFLKKLTRTTDHRELSAIRLELLENWEGSKQDKYQRDFFYYFPYCEWISSKLNGVHFRDHLRLYRATVRGA